MKRLLKVTAMTGLLTLLKMAMGFVIAKIVAIYTGPTGLAMLGQVQSMINSFNGIVNSPAGSGVVRYTSEKYKDGYQSCSPWWRASLQLIFITLTFLIPLGIFFSEYLATLLLHDEKLSWVIIISVCLLPFTAIGTLCNSVINGQQQYRRFVTIGMISTIISSILMMSMIILYNIQGALLAAAIQSGITGFVVLLLCLRQPWIKIKFWLGTTSNSNLKSISGYMLMALTSALTVPISLILVRNIIIDNAGWEAAGQWQAVWKISEVYLAVVTMGLATYYLPKLSSLVGFDAIIKEVNNTVKVIIPIVIFLSSSVYFLRDFVIDILFTEDFRAARDLFLTQLMGDVIKVASWLYAYPMLSRGATKWFVCTEIFFSSLLVLLSYCFVNIYGVLGATIAYLVNYTLCLVFIRFNVNKFYS